MSWVSVSVKVNGSWEVKNVVQQDTFVTLAHRLTNDKFQGDETVHPCEHHILPTQDLIAISCCSEMKLNKNNKSVIKNSGAKLDKLLVAKTVTQKLSSS